MAKVSSPIGLPLHQIPKDPRYRELILAPPGCWFVVADCDSQETHIIGEQSRDPKLLEIYDKGLDPHAVTASAIGNVEYSTVVEGYKMSFRRLSG